MPKFFLALNLHLSLDRKGSDDDDDEDYTISIHVHEEWHFPKTKSYLLYTCSQKGTSRTLPAQVQMMCLYLKSEVMMCLVIISALLN